MQNFAPSGFSAEQFRQRIADSSANQLYVRSCIMRSPLEANDFAKTIVMAQGKTARERTTRWGVVLGTLSVALLVVLFQIGAIAAGESNAAAEAQATQAAQKWLKLVDGGEYKQSWESASSFFKVAITDDQWAQRVAAVREPLGQVVTRKLTAARYTMTLPGAPDGKYVVIRYATTFQNKQSAVETVTPMLDADGEWRVSGYYIR